MGAATIVAMMTVTHTAAADDTDVVVPAGDETPVVVTPPAGTAEEEALAAKAESERIAAETAAAALKDSTAKTAKAMKEAAEKETKDAVEKANAVLQAAQEADQKVATDDAAAERRAARKEVEKKAAAAKEAAEKAVSEKAAARKKEVEAADAEAAAAEATARQAAAESTLATQAAADASAAAKAAAARAAAAKLKATTEATALKAVTAQAAEADAALSHAEAAEKSTTVATDLEKARQATKDARTVATAKSAAKSEATAKAAAAQTLADAEANAAAEAATLATAADVAAASLRTTARVTAESAAAKRAVARESVAENTAATVAERQAELADSKLASCFAVRLRRDSAELGTVNLREVARSMDYLREELVEVHFRSGMDRVKCGIDANSDLTVTLALTAEQFVGPEPDAGNSTLTEPIDSVFSMQTIPDPDSVRTHFEVIGQAEKSARSRVVFVASTTRSDKRVALAGPIGFYSTFMELYSDTTEASAATTDVGPRGQALSIGKADGTYVLWAHVRVAVEGGETVVLPPAPIRITVSDAPWITFSITTHPGGVAITRLACRDIVGTNQSEADDLALGNDSYATLCAADPTRSIWVDSLYTSPFALRARTIPAAKIPWFGISADLAAAGFGAAGIFGTEGTKDARVGFVAPLSLGAGIDIQPILPDTNLSLWAGGGAAAFDGAAGTVIRPYFAVNLSISITTKVLTGTTSKTEGN